MDHLHHGSRSRFDYEHLIGYEGILVIYRFRHQLDDRFRQRLELDRIGNMDPDRGAKTYRSRILLGLAIADALINGVALRLTELKARDIARRIGRRGA